MQRLLGLPDVPDLHGVVQRAHAETVVVLEEEHFRDFNVRVDRVLDSEVRSCIVAFRAKPLQGAIQAGAHSHTPVVREGHGRHTRLQTLLVLAFDHLLVRHLLLNVDQLHVPVPEPDRAVKGTRPEDVLLQGVEASVINHGDVSPGLVHVLDVHVSLDALKNLLAVAVDDFGLRVAGDDQDLMAGDVEGEVADGVHGHRLEYPEGVHVLVHALEVPEPDLVVVAACGYPDPGVVERDRGDGLRVALQQDLVAAGDPEALEVVAAGRLVGAGEGFGLLVLLQLRDRQERGVGFKHDGGLLAGLSEDRGRRCRRPRSPRWFRRPA